MDKFWIAILYSLGHSLASMLAAQVSAPGGSKFIYGRYKLTDFPDVLDIGTNIGIGCSSGKMPWLIGQEVCKLGITSINMSIMGKTHCDCFVLTGDLPLASNNLGRLAIDMLLANIANRV